MLFMQLHTGHLVVSSLWPSFLLRCLQSAVVFYALHCNVMNSAAVFWDVYHSIVSTASSIEVRTITSHAHLTTT